jgi:hypothetical protein
MYKESNRAILAKEPGVIVVMEDDEEVKLETRDAYDKPPVQKSLNQLVRFLDRNQNDADWDNLVPFLNGLAMAKQNLRQTFPPKITRKACEVGKEHIIISCAAKTKETGLSLRQAEVARELMLGQHNQAVLASFKGPEMETIRRRAELVARMLEDQLSTSPKLEKGECDARRDPVVLAVLLELAAEKAVHKYDGKDQDGLVANYANKLLHLEGWKPSSDLQGATTSEQNIALVDLIPIQNSMKWALKVDSVKQSVLGKRLEADLQSLTLLVESTADSLRAAVGNKPRRGLQMFDQLYGMSTGDAAVEAPKSTPSASPSEVGKEEEQP